MMMAPDWSPPPQQPLPAETLESVRRALTAFLTNGQDAESLRGALRELSEAARERDMHPEQVLVVLKDLWYALPALDSLPTMEQQTRLLQKVVTLCIKEYYGA